MDHHHEVFHSFQFQVRFATMKGWQELVDEKETDISWGFAVLWHRTLTSKAPHLSEAFLDGYKLLRTRVLCHQAWLGTFCLEHTRGIVRDGIRAHLFHSLEGVSEPVRLLLMLCCVACCAIHGDNFAESWGIYWQWMKPKKYRTRDWWASVTGQVVKAGEARSRVFQYFRRRFK